MVRWDEPQHAVADGWARERYKTALEQIDADTAEVVEWIYVDDLSKFSTKVEEET